MQRPAHHVPVTDYLRLQARYAHLFRPSERTDVIARIQASADRNIARFGLLDQDKTDCPERTRPTPDPLTHLRTEVVTSMDRPFAITLDPGSMSHVPIVGGQSQDQSRSWWPIASACLGGSPGACGRPAPVACVSLSRPVRCPEGARDARVSSRDPRSHAIERLMAMITKTLATA